MRRGARLGILAAPLAMCVAIGALFWWQGPDEPTMRYQPAREPRPAPSIEAAQLSLLEQLGYLAGYRAAARRGGVTLHDRDGAFPGLNLYVSGDAPAAVLMDMDGGLLHRWQLDFEAAFPNASSDARDSDGAKYWRRVHLFPNGDLLAIFDYHGLVKLDRDSRLLWAVAGSFHHDFFVQGDRVYALSDELHEIPRLRVGQPVREDFVTILDGKGEVLRSVSLLLALENSPYAQLLEGLPDHADLFHTNAIEILDGDAAAGFPSLAAGHALVSMRHLNAIVVVDLVRGVAVWSDAGRWVWQHDPRLLANGNVLLFDNLSREGRSRVIEFEPFSHRLAWSYAGTPERAFFSEGMGTNQRLPNGNTLITESFNGRAFEVTRDLRIVWQFDNPARTGPDGALVAVVPELTRLPADTADAWLRAPAP